MDAERISQYERLVEYLEEPIREIVPPLWRLPFVVDTGYTCSGHILAGRMQSVVDYPPSRRYSWYPHRATLEFAFSVDPEMVEARDSFRTDLSAVSVQDGGVTLSFDDIWTIPSDYLPYSRIPTVNLSERYNATVPDLEKSEASVILVESLLASFWEQVATVVRKYNPEANIGPIKGKNFRNVINWAHWRCTKIKR